MIKVLQKIYNNSLDKYLQAGYVLPNNIAKAVLSRQQEFAAGRLCAIQVLNELSGKNLLVGQDSHLRPIWPDNIVGSISHTQEYICVAVDYNHNYINIGIDIESLTNSVANIVSINNLVMTDKEHALVDSLINTNISREYLSYLIFSIKESIFKCINPVYNIKFDFKDVIVSSIDLNNNKVSLSNNKLQFINLSTLDCRFNFIPKYNLIYTRVMLPVVS